MHLTDEQFKIYLAGYFDVSGALSIVKRQPDKNRSPNYEIAIYLRHSNDNFLKMMKDRYDCHYKETFDIIKGKKYKARGVYIPYKYQRKFCEDILPYLLFRQERIILAIEMDKLRNKPGVQYIAQSQLDKKERIFLEMKKLIQAEKINYD